mmetsp:Transcript_21663/g.51557  ORF Transcript_21663/g.51557 Transcript_21663/m.51557 type:complete len:127 (+) Transcript_21663:427-807(+)
MTSDRTTSSLLPPDPGRENTRYGSLEPPNMSFFASPRPDICNTTRRDSALPAAPVFPDLEAVAASPTVGAPDLVPAGAGMALPLIVNAVGDPTPDDARDSFNLPLVYADASFPSSEDRLALSLPAS